MPRKRIKPDIPIESMTMDQLWKEHDKLVAACAHERNQSLITMRLHRRRDLLDEARARNNLAILMKEDANDIKTAYLCATAN